MNSKKRFYHSDALLYVYDSIEYPYNHHFKDRDLTFHRNTVHVHASEGVTWQDITDEIHRLNTSNTPSMYGIGTPLLTCMVDYPDFVVALTLKGANKIIDGLISVQKNMPREYLYFDMVDSFAKGMVENRDQQDLMKVAKLDPITTY